MKVIKREKVCVTSKQAKIDGERPWSFRHIPQFTGCSAEGPGLLSSGIVWMDVDKMTTRQASKSQKLSSRVGNSPMSSTTSSSKQFREHSIDCVSSPASSSARSKPQLYYSESVSAETERPKENVTLTVRFRPLRWN
ncbi:hypothetical protein RND71_036837 [Anisodus tanguticus]|uniref:Kinesin motor domain-containing protein n=1 Tax=Anisodus tanguticus TaxID=243964 RepID=A0AAE1R2L0_9SOLA|nr:hypothetical protein RND71_036837 [Anisodus tanguticus]